ncbi:MAG: gamma-glutamyltransferase, partial [Myxococcales bacterium]|nr:gamma-glutamyltransferase [Myxococcales bacterium]
HPRGFHRDAPGHRLTTMMAPTLAHRTGGDALALGSGGANRLRNAILTVLCHLMEHGRDPVEAVAAPRLHLETQGGGFHLAFEDVDLAPGVADALCRMWPDATRFPARSMFFGGVHLAWRRGDALGGHGDARRGGAVRLG